MQTTNISLPDCDDERRKAQERLEAFLIEGIQSERTEMTRQDWDDIRREGG